jgi:murein DD-endopeptidase MepM/ murein hydrolase activator NlpD
MDKKFTITIHDLHGVRQYNLHQIIKKVALYATLFIVFSFLVGVFSIVYLDHTVDAIKAKKEETEQAYKELQQAVNNTQDALLSKKKELEAVSDRLNDIETMIGLAPAENVSLAERAETAHLTSEQVAILLQYVPNGSPVEYKGITSKFGYRTHPILKRRELHRGTDLRAAMNTPVYATANGVVEYSGYHKTSGYGRLIILDHSYGFKTFFGHLKKMAVKTGEFVRKGELIGYSGNSGKSNGPHLHYEVRFVQRPLNPYWFIKWDIRNYQQIFEKETKVPWQSLIAAVIPPNRIPETVPPLSQKVLLSRAK